MLDFIKKDLADLKRHGLLRLPVVIDSIKGAEVVVRGKRLVTFCTNDYLGLGQSKAVIRAAGKALREDGWSTAAPRLLSGTTKWHDGLEKKLAKFKGSDGTVLYTSGYAANIGALSALAAGDGAFIAADRLNHASLIDGARLSRAEVFVYEHRDMTHLEKGLRKSGRYKRRFIVTDGVFSMDGDLAPLPDMAKLAKRYDCALIVDEAHATGVLGAHGRGTAEHFGVEDSVAVSMGTLSKALGSVGGFASADADTVSFLRSRSRAFIFTTSFPMPVCAAGMAAVDEVMQRPALRKRLWENTWFLKVRLARMGFDMRGSESPIIPIVIGEKAKTLKAAKFLWNKGFYAPAIRPPTVPEKMCRLRLTVSAMHTREQLERLVDALRACAERIL